MNLTTKHYRSLQNFFFYTSIKNYQTSTSIEKLNICRQLLNKNAPQDNEEMPRKILVEFSSPNIAKPFHVGHLRSTIIGNFISNLFKYSKNHVVRINYLGDWGTQFGYLKVGLDMVNYSEQEMKQNPIKNLYSAYVKANKLAEKDPSIAEKARKIFQQLEDDSFEDIDKWSQYREFTVTELKSIYNRLGVEFDEYTWESMYSRREIVKIINLLEHHGLLLDEIDGKKVVRVNGRRVPIVKSDGTTLYLTRDIAALLDRFEHHKFDKMFYVVDNAQADHFTALFSVIRQLKEPCAERVEHIKFGRIKGMSTRKGIVVFLQDILDEARDIMLQKQINSPTTKVNTSQLGDDTADILGISAVIVNDLKQRRQRDYDFDWNKALQVNGDTGIKLQYTHCRLCSLAENSGVQPADDLVLDLLKEEIARNLLEEVNKFPSVILKCQQTLEACILVNYLFGLCNLISRCLKVLKVKQETSIDLQQQKMLLFNKSRAVLKEGMIILGLRPLEKM